VDAMRTASRPTSSSRAYAPPAGDDAGAGFAADAARIAVTVVGDGVGEDGGGAAG
jgi:hypothetical protein